MNSLINRTKMIFVLIVIFSLITIYFGIYRPMKDEIESNITERFILVSQSKIGVLLEAVDKSIQGARSLSSRTMIRNKIVEYNEDKVSLDELKDFTYPKYLDGVEALENVIFARRVVGNSIIAEMKSENYVHEEGDIEKLNLSGGYFLKLIHGKYRLKVVSEIKNADDVIGYDYVAFDLTSIIKDLTGKGGQFNIVHSDIYLKKVGEYQNLFEDPNTIYYVVALDKTYNMVVSSSKDELYLSISKLAQRIGVIVFLGYFIIFVVFSFYIVYHAKNEIDTISCDRDSFKEFADKDDLTGAYSRMYFENYVKDNEGEFCTIVLIDIDKFKQINDNYGHQVGDEVLKGFVSTFVNKMDQGDFLVRYGGDEFLAVFKSFDINKIINTIEGVRIVIKNLLEFEVDFSYGISKVENMDVIYEKIKEADEKMYVNKIDKRN